MSHFTLQRVLAAPTFTRGWFLNPEGKWICACVEDLLRHPTEPKVVGETCIDAGDYYFNYSTTSGLYHAMKRSKRYDRSWMKFLPVIEKEVGTDKCGRHTYIRAHTGVGPSSSKGCPITGLEVMADGKITHTNDGFRALHDALLPYFEHGRPPKF